jgi:tetratricopeptide (TPR) repeat protein
MIGSRLRRLRLARGMTQSELAAPKYTHAYVSSIEAGRRRPSQDALSHFASKLGVEIEELQTGRQAGAAARLQLRLAEAMVTLSAGGLDEAGEAFRSIAKEARRAGLPLVQAKAEEGLGLLLERQERPEDALEQYRLAEQILQDRPAADRVDAVAGKARCFHSLGDVRYEIHILEMLLTEIEREQLIDPNALARLHAALVFAYVDAGLYEKAAESAAELEALSPRVNDPLRVAQMNLHVARAYLVQGRVEEAERSLHRAEDAYRQLSLKTETGYAHLALGYVHSRAGKRKEARMELEDALAIFEETGDVKDRTRAMNELGRLERQAGRTDRARDLLETSISLMRENDTPILAWAHRELGLLLSRADAPTAEKHLRTAIEIYERSDQTIDVAVTYRALGDLLRSGGDGDAGCEAYRRGIMALEPRL